jgi:hypothetical protein
VAATIAPTVPAATVSSLPDKAEFVSDVTVPDGTKYAPGTAFTKTWRLKNTGTTTWTTAYQVRYYAGDAMGSSSSKAVPNEVAPGATVDISIDLKAPSTAGSYQTTFVLSNAEGYNFSNFYVLIEVTGSTSATNTPTDDNDDDDDDDKTQTPAPTATEVVVPTETPSS